MTRILQDRRFICSEGRRLYQPAGRPSRIRGHVRIRDPVHANTLRDFSTFLPCECPSTILVKVLGFPTWLLLGILHVSSRSRSFMRIISAGILAFLHSYISINFPGCSLLFAFSVSTCDRCRKIRQAHTRARARARTHTHTHSHTHAYLA